MLADTSASTYANGVGLDTACIKWTGGFWKEVVDICARNMVPNLKAMFENKDISHVVENFRIAAGQLDGDFCGTVFQHNRQMDIFQPNRLSRTGKEEHEPDSRM